MRPSSTRCSAAAAQRTPGCGRRGDWNLRTPCSGERIQGPRYDPAPAGGIGNVNGEWID